jgi:hypothetical protein
MTPGLVRTSKRRLRREARRARGGFNPVRRAREYEVAWGRGQRTYEEVAAVFGVTRAAVCQYLVLLHRLPSEIVARIEAESDPARLRDLSLRRLVRIARLLDPADRRAALWSLGFRGLKRGPFNVMRSRAAR